MTEVPRTFIQIGGLKTAVAVAGESNEGTPILLLHGWQASIDAMWKVALRLANEGFCVHAVDFPGFGETDLPPEAWTVPQYAAWVISYMNEAGLAKVNLIGHSFGGRVSLVLGAAYPERVEKIVLSNSAGVILPPSVKMQFYYAWRRVLLKVLSLPGLGGTKERVTAALRQRYGSSDYLNAGELIETFKLVISQDLREYARRIQAPTLLFWGDQDAETPLEIGRILEDDIPDAALILFEGAGHYAYLDDIGQFIQVVMYFFKH
jgi:pimeloyl-ACP methyl ester carboxylesterase